MYKRYDEIFWRDLRVLELDCGRPEGWNPFLSHGITVYRRFDPEVGEYRPLVEPVTQLIDPFGEVKFHSRQGQQFPLEPSVLQSLY